MLAGHLDAARLVERLAEADAVEETLRNHPPREVVETIETPWPFQSMLASIFRMTWRFVRADGSSSFLTSDNPAYFFAAYGLGRPESELIFPLDSRLLLHCSWRRCEEVGTHVGPEKLVKELNRRIASGAERFIFYHAEASWVLKVAMNTVQQLNRIAW